MSVNYTTDQTEYVNNLRKFADKVESMTKEEFEAFVYIHDAFEDEVTDCLDIGAIQKPLIRMNEKLADEEREVTFLYSIQNNESGEENPDRDKIRFSL